MEAQTQTGRPTGEDTTMRGRVLEAPPSANQFAEALCAGVLVAVKELTFAIRDLNATMARQDGHGGEPGDWLRRAARRQ